MIGGGLHTRGPQSPEALVAAAPELEALPIVAQRVLAILRDERTTIDGISKLLGTDQALASAVLRHANSASAMPNRKIANLREGIARIGQRALSQVLVRACAAPMLDRGRPATICAPAACCLAPCRHDVACGPAAGHATENRQP